MKNLLLGLCFLLPLAARADRQVVVRDGDKGEITLRITQDGDVYAFPAPSFEYYPNRISRPQTKSFEVPLYRQGRITGETDDRRFGMFRATDLVVIEDRIFAVVREKAGKFNSPSYLQELRVKFGHQLHWMESGMPVGALGMIAWIWLFPRPEVTQSMQIGVTVFTAALFLKWSWDLYVTSKNAAGDGHLSQKDGDLVRIDEVERDGELVTDLLVSPAGAPTFENPLSLRTLLSEGCGPILSSNANPNY